ncbi:MAG: NAD+ synthase [Chloroflexota bacterium]|nr:NAD+ synthase [Chloroflexota bacterium]
MTIADRISTWIAEQVRMAGAEGAMIGLSGGLDSSLTAVLAKRALGDKVLGLFLPCHSDPQDLDHAQLVAEAFHIRMEVVDLTPVFDAFLAKLPEGSRVAQANLKARLRMVTLYYYANLHNYLVVGTSNRSENSVGYFTKFGDGGADILPLGGLLKGQVRKLARKLGVPQPIIEKPPSGGLWPGQTDEGEMGITYREIDEVLRALEAGEPPRVPAEALEKVQRMREHSAHKRAMPPICPLP